MHQRPFKQIDVFSDRPGYGNPVAVVLDADGLSDSDMRRFAAWTNLSETTFLMPPTDAGRAQGADYRVRIFTPAAEMPFAGHPTLGTCHAWLAQGGTPQDPTRIVQECAKGLIPIQPSAAGLAFATPATRALPLPAHLHLIYEALGITNEQVLDAAYLDNGPHWLCLLLDNTDSVLGLEPDLARIKALGHKVGVAALYQTANAMPLIGGACQEIQTQLEVRAFSSTGVEDPVTGSLNGSLAQWLIAQEHVQAPYMASQGTRVGRNGRVSVQQDAQQQLWIGGHTVTCMQGTVQL